MRKTMILTAAVLGTVSLKAQNFTVDKAHSSLGFIITHLKYSEMPGEFKSYDIKFTSSKDDFSDATVEMTGDVNSINTSNDGRDKHLKGPDFFDAEKNPQFKFKSTSFKKAGAIYKIVGDLTLHGVTKQVTLTATFRGKVTNPAMKTDVYVWKIGGKIKRSDFGIAPNMANDMVDDIVNLNANLELSKS